MYNQLDLAGIAGRDEHCSSLWWNMLLMCCTQSPVLLGHARLSESKGAPIRAHLGAAVLAHQCEACEARMLGTRLVIGPSVTDVSRWFRPVLGAAVVVRIDGAAMTRAARRRCSNL